MSLSCSPLREPTPPPWPDTFRLFGVEPECLQLSNREEEDELDEELDDELEEDTLPWRLGAVGLEALRLEALCLRVLVSGAFCLGAFDMEALGLEALDTLGRGVTTTLPTSAKSARCSYQTRHTLPSLSSCSCGREGRVDI